MVPTSRQIKRGDRRARQNKSSGNVQTVRNSAFPPQFQSNVELKHRFRFSSIATSPTTITRADLLDLLMVNLSSSTSNARIISGIKLNRVEIWGVAGSGASDYASATVSLEWLSNLGPTSETSDTGNALNPPHVVCTPPPQSLASFWSITGQNESEILMNITPSLSCVIDVWVSVVMFDGETSVTITTSNSGTAGQLYAGYLDGPGAGSGFVPVSYKSLN